MKELLLTLIAWKVTNKELLVQLSIKEDFFKNSTILTLFCRISPASPDDNAPLGAL